MRLADQGGSDTALAPRTDTTASDAGKEAAVLVIEPNEEHQVLSTMALGRRGFRVTVAGTGREGLRLALSHRFDVIVLDFKLRDVPAFDVLSVLAERVPDVPKIFVVTAGQEQTAVRALSSGAAGYLVKTARYNELLPSEVEAQIRAAKARHSLKEQRQALGESQARFQKVFQASPVAIGLATREDIRFLDANDALLRLLGRSKEELVGYTFRELRLVGDDRVLAGLRQRIAEGGSLHDEDIGFRTKSGDLRTGKISVESIEIEGEPCYLTILRDVTEERRDARMRASVYEISEATASAQDIAQLFREIHRIVAGLMPAENLYIALYDSAKDELSFPYFVDEKEAAPAPYKAGRGLTEYVLRTGAPLLASPEVLEDLVARGEVESVGAEGVDWLGVPLVVGGRTIGVLAVQSYGLATRYTSVEEAMLAVVSSQVALAIDRRRSDEARRRAEGRFRTMFEEAPMGIILVDLDGRVRELNPAVQRMIGYTAEELRGRPIRDITFPEDIERSLRSFQGLVHGVGPGYQLEKRYVRKDGTPFWVRLTATLLKSQGPEPNAVLGMVEDITAAKEALDSREVAARRFTAMIEKISDGISLLGPDGTVTWQSPSALRLFGYIPEEVLGKTAFAYVHPEDMAQLGPVFEDLMSHPGKSVVAEFRILHKNGSWRWMEAIGTNLLNDPDLHAVVLNYRDITERNEALDQIRFQASLLSQVRNAVIAIDRDLRIVYWNEFATAMYGWKAPEVYGKPVTSIGLTTGSVETAHALTKTAAESGHWAGERTMTRKDGRSFPAEVTLTALRDRAGSPIGYVGVSSDITERVRSRQELEMRAEQHGAIAALGQRALVEPLMSAFLNQAVEIVAKTLQVSHVAILEVLPHADAVTLRAKVGWDIPLGTRVPNPSPDDWVGHALASRGSVVTPDMATEARFRPTALLTERGIVSGVSVAIPGQDGPFGILAVHSTGARDFSRDDVYFCEAVASLVANALERRRVEKVLSESERLASLGQLAAYVAHEVNTPLTNISLLASSIARRETDPEILRKLEAIGVQRRRATSIITDLLEVPRQRTVRRSPEDVRKVISAAIEQVAPYRRPEVTLATEVGERAVFANMDVLQIRDVLVNLLKNALQATTKGSVTVRLAELPDFLFITVEDTGVGIAPKVLDELMHPASPARPASETGSMGLATSRSIVAAHGGKIEATSEMGKGSSFVVILPRFEAH